MGPNRPTCRGCGKDAPETLTNYTLISQKHGWRLILQADEDGQRRSRWWCPDCWARRRAVNVRK